MMFVMNPCPNWFAMAESWGWRMKNVRAGKGKRSGTIRTPPDRCFPGIGFRDYRWGKTVDLSLYLVVLVLVLNIVNVFVYMLCPVMHMRMFVNGLFSGMRVYVFAIVNMFMDMFFCSVLVFMLVKGFISRVLVHVLTIVQVLVRMLYSGMLMLMFVNRFISHMFVHVLIPVNVFMGMIPCSMLMLVLVLGIGLTGHFCHLSFCGVIEP